jgi:ATP-dependent helicase/nuclease subunit A
MPDSRRRAPDQDERDSIASQLDLNLLVEAGAGSGKTQSLADRMAAGIAKGVYDIEHMAAVTFTRKAAAELRGRFQLALEERLGSADTPEDEKARIRGALGGLERLFAGTIHAFCARLLRERPVEANLAPGFTELDPVDDEVLRRRAWRNYLARERAAGSTVLRDLTDAGVAPADLDDAFETICTFEEVTFPPGNGAPPDPKPAWAALQRLLKKLESRLQAPIKEDTSCKVQQRMRECRWRMRVADRTKPAEVAQILQRWETEVGITQIRWADDPAVTKPLKQETDRWLAEFRDGVVAPFLAQWRQYVYRLAITLLTGAREFARDARFGALKLNYNDLLQGAARLLARKPEVRLALREKYRWLFVDEFQDTDPIQAEVVLLLASDETGRLRPGSLFIVGDPKQSIYRFRRADIQTYNQVRDRLIADGGRVVSLTTSFRALPELCDWPNQAFLSVFPPEATPHQPAFQELKPYRTGSEPERVKLDRGVKTLTIPADVPTKEVVAEDAAAIARYIRSQLDEGSLRQPGDFLVLAAKRKQLAVYASALEALEVPIEVSGAGAFGDSEEVALLGTLLRALADPDDGVAVVGVLRGPLFGISDEDLFAHRQAGGYFNIWDVTRSAGRQARDARETGRATSRAGLQTRETRETRDGVPGHPVVLSALTTLSDLYRLTRELPLPSAVERILERTGFLALAAAQSPGGADAGDLLHAVDRVREVTEEGGTLADAADALDEAAESSEAESWPLEPGRTRVVRVMNVHKAKGLEADVVFLADPLGGPRNSVDIRIERTGAQPVGWFRIIERDPDKDYDGPVIAEPEGWTALVAAEQPFVDAERGRVRYVAATRAKDLLVVSRWAKPSGGKRPWEPFEPFLGGTAELAVPKKVKARPSSKPDLSAKTRARLAAERDVLLEGAKSPTFTVSSVTASTHRELVVTEEDPARILRGPATGIEWGDLIHALLEYAMSHPACTRTDLDRYARWLTLEKSELRGVVPEALDLVGRVMASETWVRAQAADECHVEVPFAITQPGPDGRPVVLSGVIDLAFRDADGWKIVDYKSDQVVSPDGRELVDKYAPQLDAYAAALKQIVPSAHVTTGLYAVRAGKLHVR